MLNAAELGGYFDLLVNPHRVGGASDRAEMGASRGGNVQAHEGDSSGVVEMMAINILAGLLGVLLGWAAIEKIIKPLLRRLDGKESR